MLILDVAWFKNSALLASWNLCIDNYNDYEPHFRINTQQIDVNGYTILLLSLEERLFTVLCSIISIIKNYCTMSAKNLVSATSRYIVGRNAVQTVYWRSTDAASPSSAPHKMLKVSKTVKFGKSQGGLAVPPSHVQQEYKLRVWIC